MLRLKGLKMKFEDVWKEESKGLEMRSMYMGGIYISHIKSIAEKAYEEGKKEALSYGRLGDHCKKPGRT